jgi:hypothetical protein
MRLESLTKSHPNWLKSILNRRKKFRNKLDTILNEEEKKEYGFDGSLSISSGSEYRTSNPKIAKLLAEDTARYGHREHIRRASKESMFVYLVIIFEEFLSNLLSALFVKRNEILKGSGKKYFVRRCARFQQYGRISENYE